MDRRTKVNLSLFLRRFKRNYHYFTRNYSGKNATIYIDQFINDNKKLAETLFGNEGVRSFNNYVKEMHMLK